MVISTLYELPFFKKSKPPLRFMLGGWRLGAISLFSSGAYLTPSSYGAQFTGPRPDLLGNPNLPRGERTIDRWFDTSVFSQPAPYTLGNLSPLVTNLRNHYTNNMDLSLFKQFQAWETEKNARAQVRPAAR